MHKERGTSRGSKPVCIGNLCMGLISHLHHAEKETGKSLKVLCTDGGGEYMLQAFSDFLSSCRVKHEVTNMYTPQENGVLEHANCTINNLVRSMIADAKEALNAKALPLALWSQAVHHAVWIKNYIPSCSLNQKTTPYQEYLGERPNLVTLHLFGCKAYAHVPKVDQTKFGEHTVECVHVGFAEKKKAYLLYN